MALEVLAGSRLRTAPLNRGLVLFALASGLLLPALLGPGGCKRS